MKREIARIEEEIRQEQRQEQKRAEKTETKTEIKTKTETKTKTEVPTPPKTKVAETAKPFGRLPPPPPVYPDISEKAPEPTAAQPEPSLPPVSDAEPKPVEQEAAAPKVQFTRQQAQNIAQAFGQPQLADVFYYGSPFLESKKQKLKKGKLEQEEYEAPSVTKAGRVQAMEEAQAQALEEFAAAQETEDNDVNQMLDTILGSSSDSASLDEIMRIAQGV